MISRKMTFCFANANQFAEGYEKKAAESILSLLSTTVAANRNK